MGDKQALRKLIEAVDGGSFTYHDVHNDWPSDIWPNIEFAYEGSLDAAKALHEALLPEWRLSGMGESDCTASGWFAHVTKRESTAKSISAFDQPRPSRSWLLAILRAYEAQ